MTTMVGNSTNSFPTPVTTPAAAVADKASDKKTLNQDFDQFLLLLTTQLKNQDPLSPMDSTEFTNQLVNFSQVEQQIKTNDNLSKLLTMSNNSQTTLGLSYIGLSIGIKGNRFEFDPNSTASVKVNYNLPAPASTDTISIMDQNGNTVYTTSGELLSGTHSFTWNGKDQSGQSVPAGIYTLQVSAVDGSHNPINVSTQVPGYVTGIQTADDGSIELMVGTLSPQLVPLSSVTQASL
jgi:flagellar basal-body rod modification protein FlgD